MLKIAIIAVLVLIAGFLLFVATRPDTFRVERSVGIQASPEKILPLINDFHRWEEWSPWEKVDPAVKRSYSGPASGVGAIYEWSGNKDLGSGRIEIVESSPSKVVMNIDFITPIEAHNKVEFTLVARGNATVVTEAMYGTSNFLSKGMHLFFNMDKMIGEKYEEGFASMKAIAEM